MPRARHILSLLFVVAVAIAGPAFAVVVTTTDNQVGPGGAGSTFTPPYTVSGSDLIHNRLPSASGGNFASAEITGGLPVLTDGTYGTITEPGAAVDRTHLIFAIAGGGSNSGTFATYSLDTAASPLGYNLSRIDVYGGWNDNSRDQQLYFVNYSTVSSPGSFLPLGFVDFNPNIGANLQSATRVTLTENALPFLATNVAAVRFSFSVPPENMYTGYAEIDVIGQPVPEPASLGVLGVAAGMGLRRRRRA